mgnify:CR=1 FL=1
MAAIPCDAAYHASIKDTDESWAAGTTPGGRMVGYGHDADRSGGRGARRPGRGGRSRRG